MYLLCSAVYTVTSLDQHHVHTLVMDLCSVMLTLFLFFQQSRAGRFLCCGLSMVTFKEMDIYRYRYIYT